MKTYINIGTGLNPKLPLSSYSKEINIVALQNKLRINRGNDFRKIVRILCKSLKEN